MKRTPYDPRVRRRGFRWLDSVIIFVALMVLAFGQSFIIVDYFDSSVIPPRLVTPLLLYWAIVVLLFTVLTTYNIKKRYAKPIRQISKVTRSVAEGDFSARLEIHHTPDNLDYLDVIFLDFNKMVEELASIEILKNDFVSNVSHEIKTPLAVIQNYVVLLQNENLTPEQRKGYSEVIMGATNQLSLLVSNILRLSKLENQSIAPAPAEYDLCRQLGDCIMNFSEQMETKQLDFSAEMEDCAMVLADESMVEIIWNNLLSNAIKFTPAGGKITLVQTSDERYVSVSISDTGSGIAPESVNRIFNKFYQADNSRLQKGNGLGLALVKKVIDLIGGEIHVQSELHHGSTFTVRIRRQYERG